jgi:Beta-lactamase
LTNVASGVETGILVAVLHDGRVVVDAVAGLADLRTAEPVAAGSAFFATSTGKGQRRSR